MVFGFFLKIFYCKIFILQYCAIHQHASATSIHIIMFFKWRSLQISGSCGWWETGEATHPKTERLSKKLVLIANGSSAIWFQESWQPVSSPWRQDLKEWFSAETERFQKITIFRDLWVKWPQAHLINLQQSSPVEKSHPCIQSF